MTIVLLPTSAEPIGVAAQRFTALGYAFHSRRGRIVIEPRRHESPVVEILLDYSKRKKI